MPRWLVADGRRGFFGRDRCPVISHPRRTRIRQRQMVAPPPRKQPREVTAVARRIDPTSPASAQMIVDIVHNIPEIVNRRVEYLEKHLGSTLQRWTTDESTWWFLLMMHC
jgi:hypothetical protein